MIESLHDIFVHPLTAEEKEREKEWMDEQLGFQRLWCEGWLMYDSTIVVLYANLGFIDEASDQSTVISRPVYLLDGRFRRLWFTSHGIETR